MKTSHISSPQILHNVSRSPLAYIREQHTRLEELIDRAEDIVIRLSQYDIGDDVVFSAWVDNFCENDTYKASFSLVVCMRATKSKSPPLPRIFIIQCSESDTIELKSSSYSKERVVRTERIYTTNPVADILKIWSSLIKDAGEK